MDDLISRKEAIEWVQNIIDIHLYYHPCSKSRNVPIDEVIDRLERVPSIDAVPVVRCKDCKYWDGRYCHNQWWGDGHVYYTPPIKAEDGYCDWAERKES